MLEQTDVRENVEKDNGIISKEEKEFKTVLEDCVCNLPLSLKKILINSQRFVDEYGGDVFEEMIGMKEADRVAYFCDKLLMNVPREEIYYKNLPESQFGWIKVYCEEIDEKLESYCDFVNKNCGLAELFSNKWIEKLREKNNFDFISNKNTYLESKKEYRKFASKLEKKSSLRDNRVFMKMFRDNTRDYECAREEYALSVAKELVICKFRELALNKMDDRR